MSEKGWMGLACLLAIGAALGTMPACGGGDDDDDDEQAPEADDTDSDYTGDDTVNEAPDCDAEKICYKNVECGWYGNVDECLVWYDTEGTCPDKEGYVACYCDCILADEFCDAIDPCAAECFGQFC